MISAILVGGTFMGLTALGLMQARSLTTADPRRALAYMTAAFGIGQILGPPFAGLLADRFGAFEIPSAAAAVALMAAGFVALNPRYQAGI